MYMENVICELCRKNFKRKRSQVLLAKRHYCSIKCQNLDRKKGQIFACCVCGLRTYKKNKDINNSESKKYFCGVKCSNKWFGSNHRSENHPNWINGKFSYSDILKRREAVKVCNLCVEKDPRVLVVHHIDHDRDNNSLSNLVWLCHNCHFLVHNHSDELLRFNSKIKLNADS